MIDLLLKNNEIHSVSDVSEIAGEKSDFLVAQFLDYTQADIDWAKTTFDLDFSIMAHYEDIEISSHFFENKNQVSFHFSIPYYNKEKQMVEEPVFIIMSANRLFFFGRSGFDAFINEAYPYKLSSIQQLVDQNSILKLWVSFISDYYADITENLAKRIKILASKILIEKKFTSEDPDILTQYSFNNLLIKESVNETVRIYNLLKKSDFGKDADIKDFMDAELNDLAVVSDYIQFNFERLDDLKDNINNKIDLEQNHIFKILTVITMCIALPTLVAGIYGMNFEVMPELKWIYGYLAAVLVMILSAVLPYIYFKRKKWLK
jgi:magnesium transporter